MKPSFNTFIQSAYRFKVQGLTPGKRAVPADNSYALNLDTYKEVDIFNKPVIILSKPYLDLIPPTSHYQKPIIRQFVNVVYNNQIIRVLNSFLILEP